MQMRIRIFMVLICIQDLIWNNSASIHCTPPQFPGESQACTHARLRLQGETPVSLRWLMGCTFRLRGGNVDSLVGDSPVENETLEMYSWDGRLFALRTVAGQPDALIDSEDNSLLWDRRNHSPSMLQHILAQASRTHRKTPFTVHSAAAVPSSQALMSNCDEKISEIRGEVCIQGEAADAAHDSEQDSKMESDESVEQEDTDVELQRTLDEVTQHRQRAKHPDPNALLDFASTIASTREGFIERTQRPPGCFERSCPSPSTAPHPRHALPSDTHEPCCPSRDIAHIAAAAAGGGGGGNP